MFSSLTTGMDRRVGKRVRSREKLKELIGGLTWILGGRHMDLSFLLHDTRALGWKYRWGKKGCLQKGTGTQVSLK